MHTKIYIFLNKNLHYNYWLKVEPLHFTEHTSFKPYYKIIAYKTQSLTKLVFAIL